MNVIITPALREVFITELIISSICAAAGCGCMAAELLLDCAGSPLYYTLRRDALSFRFYRGDYSILPALTDLRYRRSLEPLVRRAFLCSSDTDAEVDIIDYRAYILLDRFLSRAAPEERNAYIRSLLGRDLMEALADVRMENSSVNAN